MVKIFLDSNVIVSLLTKRDEAQFELSQEVINKARMGEVIPYTSSIVFLEVFYVLSVTYKFNKGEVLDALVKFKTLRNLVVIERIDTDKALKYCLKYHIKLSDCYIATQIPGGVKLFTFDKEFKKLPFLEIMTPDEIIGSKRR